MQLTWVEPPTVEVGTPDAGARPKLRMHAMNGLWGGLWGGG